LVEIFGLYPEPEAHVISALAAHGQDISFYDRNQVIGTMSVVQDAINSRNWRALSWGVDDW